MVLMRTTVFMFAVIAATMASSVIPAVYAAAPNGRSGFGEAASEFLAKDGEMGDHAKSLDGNGDEPGRLGIGNVRDALGVDHVSDIPDELCSQDPANSACTSNDDDESSEDDDESSEDD
jgi:hypothetical protein